MLACRDRLCQIDLYDVDLPLLVVFTAMHEPFLELTDLVPDSCFIPMSDLPDSFVGGSAPRLRNFRLGGFPFPGLPKLLLSATHLVNLELYDISHSGSFSPEALFTALSTLTSLRVLSLRFQSPQWIVSPPNQASRRLPQTRSLLPVLNMVRFEGVIEYLDDLLARIDAPRLNDMEIIFNQDELEIAQFAQFTTRTPTLEALEYASLGFKYNAAVVKLSSQTPGYGELRVKLTSRELNSQVSSLTRFSASYSPLFTAEDLYIYGDVDLHPKWEDPVENIQWLELSHSFAAVKNLYLSEDTAPHIGLALQELIKRSTTEVLPILQNIFLKAFEPWGPDSVLEGFEEFFAARKLSGQPITVYYIPPGERLDDCFEFRILLQ